MSECLKKALEIINPDLKYVLEFGVYRGRSIKHIRKELDSSYKVFGFDSFEGLPEDWIGAKTKERINGIKTGRKIDVKKGHFNVNGMMPDINEVTFYKGWFKNTIPEYIKNHKNLIGLIHIDCDLYSSTRDVLFQLNSFIIPNTLLCFDDWFYNSSSKYNDGERKAFLEWSYFFKRQFDYIKFLGSESKKAQQKLIRILR